MNSNPDFSSQCLITDGYYISFEIRRQCAALHLDPKMISALIYQESRGNVWAFRYEQGFFDRYLKGKSPDQLPGMMPRRIPTFSSELMARATSWGLMQIMGETARENGFDKVFLSSLLLPTHNLRVGCGFVAKIINKFKSEGVTDKKALFDKVLLRYNGGGNQEYPEMVRRWMINGAYKQVLKDEE